MFFTFTYVFTLTDKLRLTCAQRASYGLGAAWRSCGVLGAKGAIARHCGGISQSSGCPFGRWLSWGLGPKRYCLGHDSQSLSYRHQTFGQFDVGAPGIDKKRRGEIVTISLLLSIANGVPSELETFERLVGQLAHKFQKRPRMELQRNFARHL